MLLKIRNYLLWGLFILLALSIGMYPLNYVFSDMSGELLATKAPELLKNTIWNVGFYAHIFLGGIALLIGWLQFVKRFRNKYINVHRKIGYAYIISVFVSGFTGLFISFYATGAWHTKLGFFLLAVMWLLTTIFALNAIKNKNIASHQNWMRRSYALTFSAVTLRLWIPLFMIGLGWTFIESYKVVAWLAWIPNLLIIEYFIYKNSLGVSRKS